MLTTAIETPPIPASSLNQVFEDGFPDSAWFDPDFDFDSAAEQLRLFERHAETSRLARFRSLLFGPGSTARPGRQASTDHDCFYRTLIEGALDLITVVDEHGTIVYKSPSSERQLGYLPGELVGRNLFERVHPDDARRVRAAFAEGVHTGHSSTAIEHRLQHKNGGWRTFESIGRFRRDFPGGPLGIIHSRDITARKLLEAQVRQAQKMEAVGLMTGAIAHDFNNLLVVIQGYAELLETDDSPAAARFAPGLRKAVDRAAELTKKLLTFARPCEGEQSPACDINDVISDIQPILNRLVGRRVTVSYSLGALRAQIGMERLALDQVLLNLCVNARDAMPAGGTVAVTTSNATLSRASDIRGTRTESEYVVLEVHDTGMGMTESVKARIFEPFFTTKAEGHGTGLGLQTVFKAVEKANGWIDVVSAPGRGATFRVMLPVDSPLSSLTTADTTEAGDVTQWPRA